MKKDGPSVNFNYIGITCVARAGTVLVGRFCLNSPKRSRLLSNLSLPIPALLLSSLSCGLARSRAKPSGGSDLSSSRDKEAAIEEVAERDNDSGTAGCVRILSRDRCLSCRSWTAPRSYTCRGDPGLGIHVQPPFPVPLRPPRRHFCTTPQIKRANVSESVPLAAGDRGV